MKYLIIVLCLSLNLSGCTNTTSEEISLEVFEDDSGCEHEWEEVDWLISGMDITYDIHCSECQLEKTVTKDEWDKYNEREEN